MSTATETNANVVIKFDVTADGKPHERHRTYAAAAAAAERLRREYPDFLWEIEQTAERKTYIHRLQDENAELRQQLADTREELTELVRYLSSAKFAEDTTVQTRDVLNRLQNAMRLTIVD